MKLTPAQTRAAEWFATIHGLGIPIRLRDVSRTITVSTLLALVKRGVLRREEVGGQILYSLVEAI